MINFHDSGIVVMITEQIPPKIITLKNAVLQASALYAGKCLNIFSIEI